MLLNTKNRIYRAWARVAPHKKVIPNLKLEVCSPCQNKCKNCAHTTLRANYPDFQLSLTDLRKFIEITEKSNYVISLLSIHGPGEPLLWKYFNEGIQLLGKSNSIIDIHITTNGLLLDRIEEETWKHISLVRVSLYQNFNERDKFNAIKKKHDEKIIEEQFDDFVILPREDKEIQVPCNCICDGPMFIGDKIFYYCGPPLYDAAKLMNIDPEDDASLWGQLEPKYLEKYDEDRKGKLKYCKYCWANGNLEREYEEHRQVA